MLFWRSVETFVCHKPVKFWSNFVSESFSRYISGINKHYFEFRHDCAVKRYIVGKLQYTSRMTWCYNWLPIIFRSMVIGFSIRAHYWSAVITSEECEIVVGTKPSEVDIWDVELDIVGHTNAVYLDVKSKNSTTFVLYGWMQCRNRRGTTRPCRKWWVWNHQ